MKQGRLTWLAFGAAVAVVIAAMGWTTLAVLRLDAAEAESRRRAQLEENVRLALWRMDSALAPLIAAEHARPAAAFEPLEEYLGQVQSQRAFAPPRAGLTPPPLPGAEVPFIRTYFQFDGFGLTSPQPDAAGDLARLHRLLPRPVLLAALPPPAEAARGPAAQRIPPDAFASAAPVTKGGGKGQAARNALELGARGQSLRQQIEVQTANAQHAQVEFDDSPPVGAAMQPVWQGQNLLLARRVMLDGEEAVQGAWVDWPATRQWLLASCADLLSGADLVPQPPGATDPDARLLASLPVRLVPGNLPTAPGGAGGASPLRLSLVVAWGCVLVATAAVGLLLSGVVSLSERRGAFVSAVTHELRTPLTTLRMYTEMLCDGMVADEDRRRSYLSTLRAEADRLGHLVENVLAYSRLERNRAGYQPVVVKLGDVLGRVTERLGDRAKQAGMELVVDVPADVAGLNVSTNPLALEQILFNLVDNACKYAATATDRRIELSATAAAHSPRIDLCVRDHGPGVSAGRAPHLFRPFSKSAQEAANSAPGLGLGLALSRRLAVSMGGDLRAGEAPNGGALFTVRLPRA